MAAGMHGQSGERSQHNTERSISSRRSTSESIQRFEPNQPESVRKLYGSDRSPNYLIFNSSLLIT